MAYEPKASDFLVPSTKKYQYKEGGKVSMPLVKKAMSDAKKDGQVDVAQRASEIFNDCFV